MFLWKWNGWIRTSNLASFIGALSHLKLRSDRRRQAAHDTATEISCDLIHSPRRGNTAGKDSNLAQATHRDNPEPDSNRRRPLTAAPMFESAKRFLEKAWTRNHKWERRLTICIALNLERPDSNGRSGSQSPVPYRLATPHYFYVFSPPDRSASHTRYSYRFFSVERSGVVYL